MKGDMCSGQFLEDEVQKFCSENGLNEGEIWHVINRIHEKKYGGNMMKQKNDYERENSCSDIPMSQWFANKSLVHNAIDILEGLKNCIKNNWNFE